MVTVATRVTAMNGPEPSASVTAIAAAHANRASPSSGPMPCRSVRAPPMAFVTDAPARAADSRSPKRPWEMPNSRSMSAAATDHDPQKTPKVRNTAAMEVRFTARVAPSSDHVWDGRPATR